MNRGRWIINASPLIFLAQIDALNLLEQLTDEVVVPRSVRLEVSAGWNQTGLALIQLPDWMILREDLTLPPEIAGWDLGAGESQVLAHAVISGSGAILDDLQGRHCARVLGIPMTGTLGVILRAKKSNLVSSARPLIEELLQKGLYLSRDLVNQVLAEIGE